MIHFQHLFDEVAGVAQAGYLMLSAQFSLFAQPVVEEVGPGHDDFEAVEEDAFVAFGFVVGVYLLQGLVEYVGEGFEVGGCLFKLDEPLVVSAAT